MNVFQQWVQRGLCLFFGHRWRLTSNNYHHLVRVAHLECESCAARKYRYTSEDLGL